MRRLRRSPAPLKLHRSAARLCITHHPMRSMDPLLEIAVGSMLFALIGFVTRRQGQRPLLAFAMLWLLLLSAKTVISLPAADLPLHDFERSPLPGIFSGVAAVLLAGGTMLVGYSALRTSVLIPLSGALYGLGALAGAALGLLIALT